MGTKHITNDSAEIIYVGGKMIPPGEGRDIDETLLPPEHRDAPADDEKQPPSLDELLAEELKKPVKEMIEGLGGMTQEALERMEVLEGEAKKPRTSLLQAIATEKVARADAALQLANLDKVLGEMLALTVEEITATLESATEDELKRLAELEGAAAAPRADLLAAIAAELAERQSK